MTTEKLKENFEKQKKIAEEISMLLEEMKSSESKEEKEMLSSQIESLIEYLKKSGEGIIGETEGLSVPRPLNMHENMDMHGNIPQNAPEIQAMQKTREKAVKKEKTGDLPRPISLGEEPGKKFPAKIKEEKITELEKLTLKRMKKKSEKTKEKKEKRPSTYVKLASSFFYKTSMALIKKGEFYNLKRNLVRANMEFVPANYISFVFFTTLVSFFVAIFVTGFFLFFNFVASPPFFVLAGEEFGQRFLKVFSMLIFIPAVVYLFTYFYPSMERKSLESKINRELPFATIHMSSISNSMIEPSKIFSIILSTEEYPNLKKEFTKLLNEVNIYGYDLVTALRDMAFNSPSRKLADLYNGIATTITSGGDLPEFFEKRAQTLLFEHRIEMEKQAKAAETFMDIYISVVIAAPMILMLLLMMMRISGLGISLSAGMITLVMVLGVSTMNILFLAFLQMRQSE
ncbi:MAG: type II secretion system F family protein [Nanoarchaeota archaeon]